MVYEDISKWPNNRVSNSICYQLLRSAGSIGANIAEGYGRGTPGEFEQFLRYSRGSAAETDNWLCNASKAGLITDSRYREYESIFTEINKMIGAFISKLRMQSRRNSPAR
ncbi:MAG: four helix bundle protein [Candidatus Aureabacteria bacterium]|nr:four helix bundle protein [Candidatus Auribacterota bacterium]